MSRELFPGPVVLKWRLLRRLSSLLSTPSILLLPQLTLSLKCYFVNDYQQLSFDPDPACACVPVPQDKCNTILSVIFSDNGQKLRMHVRRVEIEMSERYIVYNMRRKSHVHVVMNTAQQNITGKTRLQDGKDNISAEIEIIHTAPSCTRASPRQAVASVTSRHYSCAGNMQPVSCKTEYCFHCSMLEL